VDALRRRAESAGASVYIEHKGDPDAGVVLLKILLPDCMAQIYTSVHNFEGERVWIRPLGAAPVPEQDISAYVVQRMGDDPDLWLVEIDDVKGRHFLNEPLERF